MHIDFFIPMWLIWCSIGISNVNVIYYLVDDWKKGKSIGWNDLPFSIAMYIPIFNVYMYLFGVLEIQYWKIPGRKL